MTEPPEVVWSRPLPDGAVPSTVTVSQDAAGRWHVSLLCEDVIPDQPPAPHPAVGIDAGLDSLLALSTGEKVVKPRHGRTDRDRLARAQCDLARAISDAAWRQLRTMPEYRTDWYGRQLVVVDQWSPSSKLCSVCGAETRTMPLDVREWTCPCGAVHDRDVNAARNILAAGLTVTACGTGEPQRRKPPAPGANR